MSTSKENWARDNDPRKSIEANAIFGDRTRAEVGFLAFNRLCVAVCANEAITVRPLYAFRPTRLVVAPSCAAHFNITQITIGKDYQWMGSEDASADCFPPLPFDLGPEKRDLWERLCAPKHRYDVAQVGMDVRVFVRQKKYDSPANFHAILWGEFVEP